MTKRILVTGASGFIGANLIYKLLAEGSDVHALVRPQSNLWRLKEIASQIQINTASLMDSDALRILFSKLQPEIIYHLAFPPGHPSTLAEKTEMVQAGVLGTIHLLETAAATGSGRFIYIGSTLEYGPRPKPLREDDPLQPSTFRGFAKAAGTLACLSYAQDIGQPILILRPTSVYGYWESTKRFIPSACLAALLHRPFTLTRPGFMHDHVFIEDVTDACWKAAESQVSKSHILNIGSGVQHTNEAVIDLIQEITGEEILLTKGEYPPSPPDTTFWQADISLARARLGWQPQHTLRAGLQKTISWLKEHLPLYA